MNWKENLCAVLNFDIGCFSESVEVLKLDFRVKLLLHNVSLNML